MIRPLATIPPQGAYQIAQCLPSGHYVTRGNVRIAATDTRAEAIDLIAYLDRTPHMLERSQPMTREQLRGAALALWG